jgi:hypothetical protein
MNSVQISQGTFQVIPLSLIQTNRVQPAERTSKGALRGLRDEIELSGFINPPVVSKNADRNTYTALDGHRRIDVAKDLGVTELKCVVVPAKTEQDAESTFVTLNGQNRKFSGKEWFRVWAQSSDKRAALKTFPGKQSKNIRQLIEWIGTNNTVALANAGQSPSIAHTVNRVLQVMLTYPAALKCENR